MEKMNIDINMKFFDRSDAVKKLQSLDGKSKKLSSFLISSKNKAKQFSKDKIAKQLGMSVDDLNHAADKLLKVHIVKQGK